MSSANSISPFSERGRCHGTTFPLISPRPHQTDFRELWSLIIRLLRFVLQLTCISHYCSKISSLLFLPPVSSTGRCQISTVRSDFIYIIALSLCLFSSPVSPAITSNAVLDLDVSEETIPVEAVLRHRAELPCNIATNRRDDVVYMVLWFRGEESIPIYSLDVRGKSVSSGKHWSSKDVFGDRAHFRTSSEPARLFINETRHKDHGLYRCRVDFRNSQSRETLINLTITVPPREPEIIAISEGISGFPGQDIGPYLEGYPVELTCIVRGGIPSPTVLWYLNEKLVDSSYHPENEEEVINHISVPNIQRSHHGANLACRAFNTLLSPPVSKTVTIELNLRPLTVSILHPNSQISSDTQYEIICESSGSHPPPKITWWLDNKELKETTIEDSRSSSNTTVSRLLLLPSSQVDGLPLICRSENVHLPGSAIEDVWWLKVVYAPILSLRMGSSLNPNDIKEGDDVYFECLIKANPSIQKLTWYHNGVSLHHNRSTGVILSNQSLVLQKVNTKLKGHYQCKAINDQGIGISNEVFLGIMYAPACQSELSGTEAAVIIAASRSEDVNITCEMDALPDNLRFYWTHTNTVGESIEIPPEIYTSQGSRSLLQYHLRSEEDFGILLCHARNAIGSSGAPCVFQIVTADCPQPVENCSIINRTSTSVELTCEAGFDGGLPQSFYLEAYQTSPAGRRGLQFNTSATTPTFSLSGLDTDGTFHFKIYAVNRKGKSSPAIMDGVALLYPAMQSAKVRDLKSTTIAIIIGAAAAFVLATFAFIVFIVHQRRHPITNVEIEKSYSREFRPSRRSSTNDELYHSHSTSSKRIPHESKKNHHYPPPTNDFIEDPDGDPDIIPSKNLKGGGMEKTYSRLSNGEINQRYGGAYEKIPLRSMGNPEVPLTIEQAAVMSNYATFRGANGLAGTKRSGGGESRQMFGGTLSSSGSFQGKPSSSVVNIDTRLIGQQLASNKLPESCV